MISKIKNSNVKCVKYSGLIAYMNDFKEYSGWQYNNQTVKTKNTMEAKILRQTHVIEKGMFLSKPREN